MKLYSCTTIALFRQKFAICTSHVACFIIESLRYQRPDDEEFTDDELLKAKFHWDQFLVTSS